MLYRRYRPKTLEEVVGNEGTKKALQRLFERPLSEIPHVFLFTGDSGCGKTTIAKILKDKLECGSSDFEEIDSAQDRGIGFVRALSSRMHYSPMEGAVKVYLLDEAHKITPDAQTALLKTLEEPPSHVYFILATTNPEKLEKPLKDRCTVFNVSPLKDEEIEELLESILTKEDKNISDSIFNSIVDKSNGCARLAIQELEKVIDFPFDEENIIVEEHLIVEKKAIDLCRCLVNKKSEWSDIVEILTNLQDSYEGCRRTVLNYCNSIMLKNTKDLTYYYLIMDCFRHPFENTNKAGLTLACYEVFTEVKGVN